MKVFWILWALVIAFLLCIEKYPSHQRVFILSDERLKDSLTVGRSILIDKIEKNKITCTPYTDDRMMTLLWARKNWFKEFTTTAGGVMEDEPIMHSPARLPNWNLFGNTVIPYTIEIRCFDWPTALKMVNTLHTFTVKNEHN